MMSIEESSAARRRISCSRCCEDSRGSCATSIVYAPPASSVHRLAISACPPESGLMYQVRVEAPPSSLPHAASVPAVTRRAAVLATLRRGDLPLIRRLEGDPRPDRSKPSASRIGHRLRWLTRDWGSPLSGSVVQVTEGV